MRLKSVRPLPVVSQNLDPDQSRNAAIAESGNRVRPLGGRIARASVFLSLLTAPAAFADVLSLYTFGTNGVTPGVATPTTVSSGLGATSITAGAGNTIDLKSDQGAPPAPVDPWLRMVTTGAWTTPALAVTNNAYFEFTLTADAGYQLDLSSLTFDSWKGGSGTRGYDVRTSVDNFSATVGQADIPTTRFTSTPVSINLSDVSYQDRSAITIRVYSYAGNAASVEYDNVSLNGTAALSFAGHVWTGSQSGAWDTTSANWTGAGSTFVNGTSDVIFIDTATTKDVSVAAGGVTPNTLTFSHSGAYTFSGGDVNVASTVIKSGSGATTLNNRVTASTVNIDRGTLVVANSLLGIQTNVAAGATLTVDATGFIDSASSVQVNGALNLSNASQAVSGLTGGANGVLTLNGTALNVSGASTYAGRITGTGSVAKDTLGTLTLSGTTSNYSGGTTVSNGGALQVNSAAAVGTGSLVVGGGGTLSLGAAVTAPITLDGGTIGVSAGITTPSNVTVNSASTVDTFNPITGTTGNDLIISGLLQGSGNLTLATTNGNNPDGAAFRLRGGASTYTGTITVNPSAKLELQTSAVSGSPMGTGKLVLNGGATSTSLNGTYSLVNVRNNSGSAVVSDANLGNNVEIIGIGAAYFTMLGSAAAGSVTSFGDLKIGDGQSVGAVATASAAFTLGFATVQLTGGTATFTPRPVGNTSFLSTENMRLGPIGENVSGSGIAMNGAATLTLTGVNTYSGPTSLLSGTTVLAAGSSIASSSSVSVASGATLDASALAALPVPSAQTLTVNGTLTGRVALEGLLKGSGTINGGITTGAGGVVAPGEAIGVLSTQNLSLAGAIVQAEVSKSVAGLQPIAGLDYDQLSAIDATAGLNPTVQLGATLSLSVGAGIEQGDVFTLILNRSSDAVAGTFVGLPNGSLFTVSGQQFQISYADDSLTPAFELSGGNDVSLIAVPEPGSALLLLGGLATCALRRRKRA